MVYYDQMYHISCPKAQKVAQPTEGRVWLDNFCWVEMEISNFLILVPIASGKQIMPPFQVIQLGDNLSHYN